MAAYLAASGWNPGSVGYVLMFGGLVSVAMQTPAGAIIDAVRPKRALLAANIGLLCCGALLLIRRTSAAYIYTAQGLIGGAAPFLTPTVTAITLGLVGAKAFDRQFGKNQSFNASGNIFTALLVAYVSYRLGYRAIFIVAIILAVPALFSVLGIDGSRIDYAHARGARAHGEAAPERLRDLLNDRVLLLFLATAFLFHLANGAMLPELGELLAQGNRRSAGPFMAACVIVTQFVIAISAPWIGKRAAASGRKRLLLVGYGALPVRGVLYTLTRAATALIAIQFLDGVANAIFGIVAFLVIKDRTQGTGRFNLAAGALVTTMEIAGALSNAVGGALVQHAGFHASFLSLAGIALAAFFLLQIAIPETLPST